MSEKLNFEEKLDLSNKTLQTILDYEKIQQQEEINKIIQEKIKSFDDDEFFNNEIIDNLVYENKCNLSLDDLLKLLEITQIEIEIFEKGKIICEEEAEIKSIIEYLENIEKKTLDKIIYETTRIFRKKIEEENYNELLKKETLVINKLKELNNKKIKYTQYRKLKSYERKINELKESLSSIPHLYRKMRSINFEMVSHTNEIDFREKRQELELILELGTYTIEKIRELMNKTQKSINKIDNNKPESNTEKIGEVQYYESATQGINRLTEEEQDCESAIQEINGLIKNNGGEKTSYKTL